MKATLFIFSLMFMFQTLASEAGKGFERFIQNRDLMPEDGAFSGEVVQYNSKRTLMPLNAQEKEALGFSPSSYLLANFWHADQFFVIYFPGVEVDRDNNIINSAPIVDDVHFIKEHWAGKVRPETKELEVHALLRFGFHRKFQPVLVYNQSKKVELKRPMAVENVIVSVEALRPEKKLDAPFMPYALGDNFAVAHLVYSWEQRIHIKRSEPETTLTKIPMVFNHVSSKNPRIRSQKTALFMKGVEKSIQLGRKEAYNVFEYNCTNRLFNLMDETLNFKPDLSYVKEDVIYFIYHDLPGVIGFVEEMAKQKGVDVPSPMVKQMQSLLTQKWYQDLKSMDVDEHDVKFMSQWPPFVEGHLRARELLR